MAEASNYLENELYDHVFRNAAFTSPATLYVSLHTADPAEDGSGAEATGGSYARQTVTFGAPTNGVGSNSNSITFSDMPAGTFTHFAIWDASTAGNMLCYSPLDSNVTTSAGESVLFAVGAISASVA